MTRFNLEMFSVFLSIAQHFSILEFCIYDFTLDSDVWGADMKSDCKAQSRLHEALWHFFFIYSDLKFKHLWVIVACLYFYLVELVLLRVLTSLPYFYGWDMSADSHKPKSNLIVC